MNSELLYLSADDVRSLSIGPTQARVAIREAFERHAEGKSQSLKKGALFLGPGHGFQTMVAADADAGIATVKWVAIAPVTPNSKKAGVNGVICVSDFTTGEPIALMDGNEITLMRTAAMSAVAASLMVNGTPETIGMIGCGMQALAHLDAFCDLFPSLHHVYAFSRGKCSSEKLVETARGKQLTGEATDSPAPVLENSDIVITMVPGGPDLVPFLDANRLKSEAFVSAVDIGRSWIPETLPAFRLLATDSLAQGLAPYGPNNEPVTTVKFHTDLSGLASEKPEPVAGRKLFCFRGYALADLALANLAIKLAKELAVGIKLPR